MRVRFSGDCFRIFDDTRKILFIGNLVQSNNFILNGKNPWYVIGENLNESIRDLRVNMKNLIGILGFDTVGEFFVKVSELSEGQIAGPIFWPYIYIEEKEDLIKILRTLAEGYEKHEPLFD